LPKCFIFSHKSCFPGLVSRRADLSGELAPKQLQLLHELLPDAARFGTLVLPYDRNPL